MTQMTPSPVPDPNPARPRPRPRRRYAWSLLLLAPAAVAAGCWWLTEPLVVERPPAPPGGLPPVPSASASASASVGPKLPAWPEGRLEGEPAARMLLETLLRVQTRLEAVAGYTATLRKQERIKGVL